MATDQGLPSPGIRLSDPAALLTHIEVPNQVRDVIMDGPDRNSDAYYTYLDAVDRLNGAVRFIEEELRNGRYLIARAMENVKADFHGLLADSSLFPDLDERSLGKAMLSVSTVVPHEPLLPGYVLSAAATSSLILCPNPPTPLTPPPPLPPSPSILYWSVVSEYSVVTTVTVVAEGVRGEQVQAFLRPLHAGSAHTARTLTPSFLPSTHPLNPPTHPNSVGGSRYHSLTPPPPP
ncbi:unnamed protein product [Closterium sp. NIES-54]